MIFLVPFAFAFDDTILLGTGLGGLLPVVINVLLLAAALYFSASALKRHDRVKLSVVERVIRFAVVIALLSPGQIAALVGLAVGVAMVGWRMLGGKYPESG